MRAKCSGGASPFKNETQSRLLFSLATKKLRDQHLGTAVLPEAGTFQPDSQWEERRRDPQLIEC